MNPVVARDVKIFGERNTSTNALKRLIEMNSEARVFPSKIAELEPRVNSLAGRLMTRLRGEAWRDRVVDKVFAAAPPRFSWKHCAPDFADLGDFRGVLVVLSVRNPFSWLLALHKRPYHSDVPATDSLARFIATPWQPLGRDRIGTKPVTPIELYNVKLGAYARFQERLVAGAIPVRVVKFEDFAIDQLAVLEGLRPHLAGLVAQPRAFTSAAKNMDRHLGRDADYYRDYYGNERWKDEIDPGARAAIDAGIDWDLAGRFGYSRW